MKILMSVLICAGACLGPMAAEPPARVEDPVARELAGIRSSLDRLTAALLEVRVSRRADLLLRRIERREVRLATLEARLRSARGSLDGEQEQLAQIEIYRHQVESEIREARERGEPDPRGEADLMMQQIDVQETTVKDRIQRLETGIRDLEDQIAEGREAIEDLDLRLEEVLALMDESD